MNQPTYEPLKFNTQTRDKSQLFTKNVEEEITSTEVGIVKWGNYVYILPDSLNIFKNWDEIKQAKLENVRKQANEFMTKFQPKLFLAKEKNNFSGTLPALSVTLLEDDSLFVEWLFNDFRLGFSFEEDEEKSSWYFIANKKFDNLNASGFLAETDIYSLLENILDIVMTNQ